MTYDDVIKVFGTQKKVAQALGIVQPRISHWKRSGHIPPLQQLRLQNLTAGRLVADPDVFLHRPRKRTPPTNVPEDTQEPAPFESAS
jgi:hypothetical protein